MQVLVMIPTVLRRFSANQSTVQCSASTLGEALDKLDRLCPGITDRLFDEKRNLRGFINFYINEDDVRSLKGRESSLKEGDVITIVPALAGG